MSTKFDFTKLIVKHFTIEDYRESATPECRDYHALATPGEPYPLLEVDSAVTEPEAMALRAGACINACAGLPLPAQPRPGLLADVVTLLRGVAWELRKDSATKCMELLNELDLAPPMPAAAQALAERLEAGKPEGREELKPGHKFELEPDTCHCCGTNYCPGAFRDGGVKDFRCPNCGAEWRIHPQPEGGSR